MYFTMIYVKLLTAIVSLFHTIRKLQAYQLFEYYEHCKYCEFSENFARILLVKEGIDIYLTAK